MAENKKSFILYCDQKGIWDKLSDEQAGKLIKHVLSYVNDENPVTDDFIIELAFESIKQQLKRDLKKWENQYNQRVLAGKKSAEIRKRNSTVVDGRSVSSTVNGNVTVNVNDNVSENIITLGNGKYFFSVTSKYIHEKSYIVRGVDGLKLYMEINKSILDFPERHEKFMREVNGDVFNEFMHVKNRFKKFIEKQYA